MSAEEKVQERFKVFLQTHKRHPADAYNFIYETLDWIHKRLIRSEGRPRHISGKELALGFRDYAIEQFGLMARTVLDSWNIRSTDHIGEMVFDLISLEMMGSSEDDQKSDFNGVFDFDEEFNIRPFAENLIPDRHEWVIRYRKVNTRPENN